MKILVLAEEGTPACPTQQITWKTQQPKSEQKKKSEHAQTYPPAKHKGKGQQQEEQRHV